MIIIPMIIQITIENFVKAGFLKKFCNVTFFSSLACFFVPNFNMSHIIEL